MKKSGGRKSRDTLPLNPFVTDILNNDPKVHYAGDVVKKMYEHLLKITYVPILQ